MLAKTKLIGKVKTGLVRKILGVGFNGTVVFTRGGEPRMIQGK